MEFLPYKHLLPDFDNRTLKDKHKNKVGGRNKVKSGGGSSYITKVSKE